MRQLIFIDKDGHVVGEFPHCPAEGFISGRRGLRRRLMNATEAVQFSLPDIMALAQQRYDAEESRIRDKQFVANEKKQREEYQRNNISVSDAAKIWREHLAVTNAQRTIKAYMHTIALYL